MNNEVQYKNNLMLMELLKKMGNNSNPVYKNSTPEIKETDISDITKKQTYIQTIKFAMDNFPLTYDGYKKITDYISEYLSKIYQGYAFSAYIGEMNGFRGHFFCTIGTYMCVSYLGKKLYVYGNNKDNK